ncbi:MAG: hypothetical protein ACR2QK_25290 [Acidimicrobiales bacterium]
MAVSLIFRTPDEIVFRSDEVNLESPELQMSLVVDVCDQLDEAGCTFDVTGCGLEWRTDVSWDLSTILHKVPNVVAALERGEDTEVYFFEQGLSRKFLLGPGNDGVTAVRVISDDVESPDIPGAVAETIRTEELVAMLTQLCVGTATAILTVNPRLAEIEPLPRWRAGDLSVLSTD